MAGSAAAQAGNWDTYMAQFNGKPGSVLVDMGLQSSAPDKRYPYLVITGPAVERCPPNGLPAAGAIEGLEEILERTTNFITGISAHVLAGTVTCNCERLNYYYVRDTLGLRGAVARMYNKNYKEQPYSIKIKYDPNWISYRTFLYPDDKTKRWMESTKIITAMLQAGDSLTQKRNINFKFNFQTEQERIKFVEAVRARDYRADRQYTTGDGVAGVVVGKFDIVRMSLVDSMAEYLGDEAKKYRGVYLGWEAPIRQDTKH